MSLDPSPEQARRLLERELSGPEYPHPTLIDRFWDWLTEKLDALSGAATGSAVGLLLAGLVALVVFGVLVAALTRVRRDRRAPEQQPAGVLGVEVSADLLREQAQRALDDGRLDQALADAARALARRCVERGVLDDAPGRTAHEVFADVARCFPESRAALVRAADTFDRVVYGARSAGRAEVAAMLDLEADLRRARPVTPTGPGRELAVPR